jgi:hypothetical protein
MPNDESTELARRLKLALTVDDKRKADDPLKLPARLRADTADDLENLEETDAETGAAEGDRTEASGKKRKAFTELERQVRGGHRFIAALDEAAISEEERAGVFEAYLWKGGKLGAFDDGRCLTLAKQAVKVAEEDLVKAEWRYPDVRLQRIKAQLEIIEERAGVATGGDRQSATKARNAAFDLAETTLLRVRFWYCCATRDADKTPELAKIEFQPRREYGSGTEGKKADAGAGGAAAQGGGGGAPGGGAPNPPTGTGATGGSKTP